MLPDRDWRAIKSHLTEALVRMKGWSLTQEQMEEIVPIFHALRSQIAGNVVEDKKDVT